MGWLGAQGMCVWGGWRVPGLPVQGSACVTRLLWQLCACTHMSCVASKASGGDKWHWGSQQPSWLWGPGSQQVEVGVLDGINQSWCCHVQSSPEAQMTGERRRVFASLLRRMISQGNEAGGERKGKREQWGCVGAMTHHP